MAYASRLVIAWDLQVPVEPLEDERAPGTRDGSSPRWGASAKTGGVGRALTDSMSLLRATRVTL